MNLQDITLKIVQGVAVAATVGGGSMLLNDHLENATQRQQITELMRAVTKVDDLREQIGRLNVNIAVMNSRMEANRDLGMTYQPTLPPLEEPRRDQPRHQR